MIDDILAGLFGEAVFARIGRSKRAQLLARVFFGLLGAALGIVGAIHFYRRMSGGLTAMSASMIAMFVFLALFCLFNVALGRTWRWPSVMFVVSFVSMFAARIIFGY